MVAVLKKEHRRTRVLVALICGELRISRKDAQDFLDWLEEVIGAIRDEDYGEGRLAAELSDDEFTWFTMFAALLKPPKLKPGSAHECLEEVLLYPIEGEFALSDMDKETGAIGIFIRRD